MAHNDLITFFMADTVFNVSNWSCSSNYIACGTN